jgi:hypothetical protein
MEPSPLTGVTRGDCTAKVQQVRNRWLAIYDGPLERSTHCPRSVASGSCWSIARLRIASTSTRNDGVLVLREQAANRVVAEVKMSGNVVDALDYDVFPAAL